MEEDQQNEGGSSTESYDGVDEHVNPSDRQTRQKKAVEMIELSSDTS